MRRFILVSGLVVLSAASAVVAAGCGGGGPCAEYCDASLSCVEADGCDIADRDKAKNECASACEAGLDKVADSDVRSAVNDCLHCLAPLYADSCQLTEQEALKCQEACLPAQSGLEAWVTGFSEAIEDTSLSCSNGEPATEGCSISSDGTTCSVECESGNTTFGAQCDATTNECTCTSGPKEGQTFLQTCDTLDEDEVRDECN